MTTLERLQEWFASVCDGDWEHSHGIEIETIDNPGWSVSISILETPLESQPFGRVEVESSEDDWYHCWVESGDFKGSGGPRNLVNIQNCFLEWASPRQAGQH